MTYSLFSKWCSSRQNRGKPLAAWLVSVERNKCISGYLQIHNCLKSEFPRRGKLHMGIMGYADFWLETIVFLFSFRCNEWNLELYFLHFFFWSMVYWVNWKWIWVIFSESATEIILNLLKISANVKKKLWIKTNPKLCIKRKSSRFPSLD